MDDWFRHLDSLGAQKMTSAQIHELIATVDGLAPLGQWNQGLLGTSYQWSRGLRERGEKAKGFEISVSKTVNVPISVLYQALVDGKSRKKWLQEKIEIRKATEDKSARVTWSDGATSLSIDFYTKGDTKSQIVVQHLKIPDSTMAAEMKELWAARLDSLKSMLES